MEPLRVAEHIMLLQAPRSFYILLPAWTTLLHIAHLVTAPCPTKGITFSVKPLRLPFFPQDEATHCALYTTSRELHYLSANLPPSIDKELLEGKNTSFFLNLLGPAQCLAQSRGSVIACWIKAQCCYFRDRICHNFIPITLTSLTAQEMIIHSGFKANDLIFFTQ